MANYFNDSVYKKVYLIEFYQGNIATPTDSFAFSVPPQNEEIRQGQRVTETKTFGGVIFDDYGNDTIQISLSGSTFNREIRKIKRNKDDEGYKLFEGNDELTELSSLITKYGEHSKLNGKLIKLYNLSTGQIWNNVVIKDFSIKRSKDKPLSYDYAISFSCFDNGAKNLVLNIKQSIKKEQDEIKRLQKELEASDVQTSPTFFEKIKLFCKNTKAKSDSFISTVKSTIKDISKPYQTIINAFNSIEKEFDTVENMLEDYTVLVDLVFDTAGISLWQEIYETGKDVIESAYRLVFDPPAKILAEVTDYVSDILTVIDEIKTDINNGSILVPENFQTEIIGQYSDSIEDLSDQWLKSLNNLEDVTEALGAETKLSSERLTYSLKFGSTNENDDVVTVYGYTEQTVKESDTWDSLSFKYYGTSEYADVIACYNYQNLESLVTGEKVYIPILDESKSVSNNQVYTGSEAKDNYGHDVKISSSGDFDVNSDDNDLSFTKNQETINQAILNRLETAMNSRMKLTYYGINSSIGQPVQSINYLKSSIADTVMQDPRIKEINNLKINGIGDRLNVVLEYTDINNEKNFFGGTL